MLKTKLLVESTGSPNVFALADTEQEVFLQTLFEKIKQLKNNGK